VRGGAAGSCGAPTSERRIGPCPYGDGVRPGSSCLLSSFLVMHRALLSRRTHLTGRNLLLDRFLCNSKIPHRIDDVASIQYSDHLLARETYSVAEGDDCIICIVCEKAHRVTGARSDLVIAVLRSCWLVNRSPPSNR